MSKPLTGAMAAAVALLRVRNLTLLVAAGHPDNAITRAFAHNEAVREMRERYDEASKRARAARGKRADLRAEIRAAIVRGDGISKQQIAYWMQTAGLKERRIREIIAEVRAEPD